MKKFGLALLGTLVIAACGDDDDFVGPVLNAPSNLFYELEASGDPDAPAGILLFWDPVIDDALEVYNVYSRADPSQPFDLRASTTSTTFHDVGIPDLEYHVRAVSFDGLESEPSNTIVVDERLRLESPNSIGSITLDGAILLTWADNPFATAPEGFKQYRIYSAGYSLDNEFCDNDWALEGTTVAPEFLASALPNGFSRCFAVSAESIEGWESLWSDVIADTPRPDARNILVSAFSVNPNLSGFRFFQDLDNDGVIEPFELGIVTAGDRTDIDFWISRSVNGDLFIELERPQVEMRVYRNEPIDDLTSIDFAPETGYSRVSLSAEPGFGYVFQFDEGDGFLRYGALRMTHVGDEFLIFDWSYQTDPGNPELQVRGGLPTHSGEGLIVRGVK